VSEKPDREDDAPADGELTDEQLDREAPGVDDAAELEAAEDAVAAEASAEEGKVVARHEPGRRGRGGRITAGEDDDEVVGAGPRRAARSASRPAGRDGAGTRSRSEAERARAEQIRQKRSLGRFLREVVAELRKVIWPGRRELITYTTVVIVFMAFMVALVAGMDLLFSRGVIAVFG
jgi:preprotein translocase subunit SecE